MRKYDGKVIITTFFYKHLGLQEHEHTLLGSIIAMERLGIKWDYWSIGGNFHMEVVVNSTLTKFLNETDATDIVFIDADESWNPASLLRLLMHEEDVVCGAYLQTNLEKRNYPVIFKMDEDGDFRGKMLPDGNCLLEAKKIPAGFMKVSRRALDAWTKAYPDNWMWSEGKKVWSFFMNEVRDHVFHGMDFVFTESLTKIGFRLWVDPTLDISHHGTVPFRGVLDKYLRAQKQLKESKDAIEIVQEMAREIEERKAALHVC